MHSSDNVYAERGLGQRQGAGVAPALVVVDLNYAFTAPQSPLHCSADEAVSATASLLDAARAGGRPVAFTTLELQYGYRVVVPREAVCDRDPAAHRASLTDIDAKYGDVVGLGEAAALLRG